MSRARQLLLLGAFTLLLHLPFLAQPVQGDEVNYLDMACHVFQQPWTPFHFRYVFQGAEVDMAGHPHPPLAAYFVALVWALWGHFSVVFFHTVYLLFALAISFAAYVLAERFTPQPLLAALLLAAAPLVQVNTNTLASPEPLGLALFLVGAALFFRHRFALGGVALSLAGFSAMQYLLLAPILLLDYALRRERPSRAAWVALAAPFLLFAAWQGLQFALTRHLPIAVLFGYATGSSYGGFRLRLASALALTQHLGILVVFVPLARLRPVVFVSGGLIGALITVLIPGYPWWERVLLFVFLFLGVHTLAWLWSARRDEPFLAVWCLAYFVFAPLIFFAGAARYLLPIVAPFIFLFVRQFASRPRWLRLGLAINIVLGLNLSLAAYEFSRVYAEVKPPPGATFLVNGEWGFRYHLLRLGGRVVEPSSVAAPGEWMVSSELSLGGYYDSEAEAIAVPLRTVDLTVRTPFRLIDRFAHSGNSSVAFGLLPFSFSRRPLDRIIYSRTSPFVNLAVPWTPTQFSRRLVYLPSSGAAVRLPLDPGWTRLEWAMFAKGAGQAIFRISDPAGKIIFTRTVQVNGELWERESISVEGFPEAVLTLETSPGLRAGWGELVAF